MAGTNTAHLNNVQDMPCTEKCKSTRHGTEICHIALNGKDEEVIALWMKTCVNYGHVKDEFGRTALHMAASLGRIGAVEWLIKREGSQINLKDLESGYTPLHRSLFYGQINTARLLVKLGADTAVKDNEGFTPLDLTSTSEQLDDFNIRSQPTEVYVWGRNQNFNLGIENQQNRIQPDILEKFGPDNDLIEHVVFQQFHSLFKTQLGGLYVCGHGEGGRLGTTNENAVLTPKKIISGEVVKVSCMAASENHTIVVYDNGSVATWGSNEFAVLGHFLPAEKVLSPKIVHFGNSIKITECTASNVHSIFYNKENIYVCGTNEGQFGHLSSQGTKIFKPVKMPPLSLPSKSGALPYIETVACNDSATAVAERLGKATTIYLFFNHTLFILKFGTMSLTKLSVLGGFRSKSCPIDTNKSSKFGKESDKTEGVITLVFMNEESINIWRQENTKMTRKHTGCPSITHIRGEGILSKIVFNTSRTLQSASTKRRYAVKDFSVSVDSLLFITAEGNAYMSVWSHKNDPLYLDSKSYRCVTYSDNKTKLTDSGFKVQNVHKRPGTVALQDVTLELLKAKRIPNVYFGEKIFSDPRGNNFAVIIRNPRCPFIDFPWVSASKLTQDLSNFLEETSEEDTLHDVIFEVEGRRFAAHRFIVASAGSHLSSMMKNAAKLTRKDDCFVIKLESVRAVVFEQILKFIYTSVCEITSSYDGSFQFHSSENIDLIQEASQFAKKINLSSFWKAVKSFEMHNNRVYMKPSATIPFQKPISFQYESSMPFCDVVLKCPLGEEFKAHRCILAARVNYFAAMFSITWGEKTSEKPLTIEYSKLATTVMLQYVYGDKSDLLGECETEVVMEVLVLADHFLLERLLNQVEEQLASRLNLRNALEIMQFAATYNAPQLKNSCFEFVCPHISQLLENRLLDQLPKFLVNELTEHYKSRFYRNRGVHIEKCNVDEAPEREEYENAMDSISPELQQVLKDLDKDVDIELKKPTPKTSKVRMRARTVSETEVEVSAMPSVPFLSFKDLSIDDRRGNVFPDTPILGDQKDKPPSKIVVPLPTQKLQEESRGASSNLNLEEFPSLGTVIDGSPTSLTLTVEEKPCCSKSNSGVKKRRKWKSLSEPKVIAISTSPPEIPVNPWVKPWEQVTEPRNETEKAFKVIVEEEQEKKSNFEKAVSKPMQLLMIEEAAMTQLMKRYTTADVTQSIETLSVDRVCPTNYAEPTWVCQNARP